MAMPSTTAEPLALDERPFVADTGRGLHEHGFATLRALVAQRAIPPTLDAERAALSALRAVRLEQSLDAPSLAARDRLQEGIRALRPIEVGQILRQLDVRGRDANPLRWAERRRRERARLLFALLGAVCSPRTDMPLLGVLVSEHVLGSGQSLDALLRWMRRPFVPRAEGTVRRAYLDLVKLAIPLAADDELEGEKGMRAFRRWPWTRQLVVLERRRQKWDLDRPDGAPRDAGPATRADQVEFHLALTRTYGGMARRGGGLVRQSLSSMRYADHAPRRSVWGWRPLLLALLLASMGAGLLGFARIRARDWNTASRDLGREVTLHYNVPD